MFTFHEVYFQFKKRSFRWSSSLNGEYGPFKRCVCVPGAQPMSRDLTTGLVPGCQQPPGAVGTDGEDNSDEPTVDDCKDVVTMPVENVRIKKEYKETGIMPEITK